MKTATLLILLALSGNLVHAEYSHPTIVCPNVFELQYQKIVSKADECYRKREYQKALELYKRALQLVKNDQHVIKRIRKIERKLS